jgi:hypothetical protein
MPEPKNPFDAGFIPRPVDETRRVAPRDLVIENENLRLLVETLRKEREHEASARAAQETAVATLERMRATLEEQQQAMKEELSRGETERERLLKQNESAIDRQGELMGLLVASHRLHGSRDRVEVVGAIQEIVSALVGCEENAIFEVDASDRSLRLLASVGIDAARYESIAFGEGTIGASVRDATVYVAPSGDASTSPDGVTACVPLVFDGKVCGAIALFQLLCQKPRLVDADREMFDLLQTHAATALHCSRLQPRAGGR